MYVYISHHTSAMITARPTQLTDRLLQLLRENLGARRLWHIHLEQALSAKVGHLLRGIDDERVHCLKPPRPAEQLLGAQSLLDSKPRSESGCVG